MNQFCEFYFLMAPVRLPFWLPIVAPALSNEKLSQVLKLSPSSVAALRARFGFSPFAGVINGPQDIDWPKLVGHLEDALLAELLSSYYEITITSSLIAAIRSDLCVGSYSSNRLKLSPQIRELVGRYSSINIAKGWDLDAGTLEAYRRLAKISPVSAQHFPTESRWSPEALSLFPIHNNAQIARATGIPIDAVRAKRAVLNIAAPKGKSYWKIVSQEDLAQNTDEKLAALFGGPTADYAAQRLSFQLQDKALCESILSSRRLPTSMTHYLTQMTTRRLAKLTGLSEFHLNNQRKECGCGTYQAISPELDVLLSTCPDTDIAKVFNVAPTTVKSRRDKLGKPAYKGESNQ